MPAGVVEGGDGGKGGKTEQYQAAYQKGYYNKGESTSTRVLRDFIKHLQT